MNSSLKIKILLSLSLLVLMLLAAGIMSMLEFTKMGDSVDGVLKNNYQSIESAKRMTDALEREDSGLLLWMIGDRDSGIGTIHRSDSIITKAITDAQANITETNESQFISGIIIAYDKYHASVLTIVEIESSVAEAKQKYDAETKALFFNTKEAINNLMVLNQDQMNRQSGIVKEKSRRAMMPAIVSIAAAIIFAILLNFFITIYFIHPLRKFINGVKEYYPEQGRLNAHVVSKDEFKMLEDEINILISRLLKKRDVSNE
ncbi:MAG: hypothetical protein ITG04_03535 [Proteiniphilum sp.]|jgi:hypothetical protein|nr:hypothetical protein [Proteiniphilum sp.]